MASLKKSKQYALYRLIPDYYVNDRGFVQKVVPDPNGIKDSLLSGPDKVRLERILRSRLRGYRVRDPDPNIASYKFRFVEHILVNRTLDPDVFSCPKCFSVYTLKTLKNNSRNVTSFQCLNPHCKEKLKQIPFLWVHPSCGSIETLRSLMCSSCHKRFLGLKLNSNDLTQSEWVCRGCGYRSRSVYPTFSQPCSNCWTQGRKQMMSLLPAIKIYRPQKFSSFNLSGDWRRLLAEWFNVPIKPPPIEELPEWAKKIVETAMKSSSEPIGEIGIELQDLVKQLGLDRETEEVEATIQEITDFAGLWQRKDVVGRMEADSTEAKALSDLFKLRASYFDGIPIIDVVFGSLIGSSDKQTAYLKLIDGNTISEKLAFVRPFTTEGILFQLDEAKLREWLLANGLSIHQNIRRHLVSTNEGDPILRSVRVLLHSISHLLIRTSEIYSGVSRETLSEIIFPRSLAFLLYNTRGSELGMLRTTFEGQMLRWLYAARAKALKCVNDPLCSMQLTPCYACMFIAERNCPEFNGSLDRDPLVMTRGDWKVGFWN